MVKSAATASVEANIPVPLRAVAICCDLDRHVFYAAHTNPKVGQVLRDTHCFELAKWSCSGPGSRVLA